MRFCTISLVLSSVFGSASVHAANDWSGFDLKPGERIVAIDGVPVNGAAGNSVEGAVRQVEASKQSAQPAKKQSAQPAKKRSAQPAKTTTTDASANSSETSKQAAESSKKATAKKAESKKAASKSESSERSSGGPTEVVATNIDGTLVRSGMPFSHTPGDTALEKANHERRKNGVGNLKPDPQLQALALKKARIAASRRYKNHIGGSLGGARAEGVGHTQGRFLSCCLDMHATYGGAAMVQGADGWYCCLLVR